MRCLLAGEFLGPSTLIPQLILICYSHSIQIEMFAPEAAQAVYLFAVLITHFDRSSTLTASSLIQFWPKVSYDLAWASSVGFCNIQTDFLRKIY